MKLIPKQRKAIEAAIQRALVAWLMDNYPTGLLIQATLNENSRHCMDMGCTEGITDLIIGKRCKDGMFYILFLELKKKKGLLTGAQKQWRDEAYAMYVQSFNTEWRVAYGFEQAKQQFLEWHGAHD